MKVQKRYIISLLTTVLMLFLTNKFWLICNSGHHRFVFETFTIILVLSFLLFYKVFDYLADFKTVENKSRIEIVFLTIFFVFLFVPMSHINQEVKSIQENRTFAKWKPLITTKGTINYNFGKDFDKWFNDRAYLRNLLIRGHENLVYRIQKNRHIGKKFTTIKENGYIFANKSKIEPLSSEEIELYAENLNKFNKYCEKNNFKLYILIPPSSASFLLDKNIVYYLKQNRTCDLVKYAKEQYNLEIIFPEKELVAGQKNEMMFYKTDHHLTDTGSYILYKTLIEKMKKDFSLLSVTPLTDYFSSYKNMVRAGSARKYINGDEYRASALSDKNLVSTRYQFYDYKYLDTLEITKIEGFANYLHKNPNGNYRLMIIGDSMQETLTYYLNTNFKEIYKYRSNTDLNYPKRKSEFDMEGWYKLIEEHKPDAVILIKHSGTFDFTDMYPKGDDK